MKRKGFGVEDAPFMVLIAVAVMMFVTWIGITAMAQFVEGNERQAAVEASIQVYERARLVSLGYDGSSDELSLSLPKGHAIVIDGSIVAMGDVSNGSLDNATELTEPMSVRGVDVVGESGEVIGEGDHDLFLTYSADEKKVTVSWS